MILEYFGVVPASAFALLMGIKPIAIILKFGALVMSLCGIAISLSLRK